MAPTLIPAKVCPYRADGDTFCSTNCVAFETDGGPTKCGIYNAEVARAESLGMIAELVGSCVVEPLQALAVVDRLKA